MNIHIHTFGCRLNQYESEKISYELKKLGANITELDNAEAIAINTCTVTNDSDKKLMSYLEKLGDIQNKKIFLIGCYVSKKDKDSSIFKDNIVLIPNEKKEEAQQLGAFVNIAPGKDGMIHISKLSNKRVAKVTDVIDVGDVVRVEVIKVDEKGRIDLKLVEVLSKASSAE